MRRFVILTPSGRLGRRDFLISVVGLSLVTTALFRVAPGFTYTVGGWLLAYLWVCLAGRRLHDMGWSAWTQLAPFLVTVGLVPLYFVLGVINLAVVGAGDGLGGIGAVAGIIMMLLFLGVWLGFLIWLALGPTRVEGNIFGGPAVA